MREIRHGRFIVTLIYCADKFYLHLIDYVYYINVNNDIIYCHEPSQIIQQAQ